jgi:hypothetical protein
MFARDARCSSSILARNEVNEDEDGGSVIVSEVSPIDVFCSEEEEVR